MMKARCVWAVGAGAMLCLPSLPAWSAAFALQEQSASRLGTAFAGAASAADDLSTMFYNVAGLAYVDRPEFLVVASAIDLGTDFQNDGSLAAFGQPLGPEGGDAGGWSLVPNLYAAMPLNDTVSIGVAVNVPFGLVTDWDNDWTGRFQARRSEIETINVAPSIAWQPNEQWSIGAGVSYQWIDAKLTNSLNYTAVIAQVLQQRVLLGQLTPAQANALIGANAGLAG